MMFVDLSIFIQNYSWQLEQHASAIFSFYQVVAVNLNLYSFCWASCFLYDFFFFVEVVQLSSHFCKPKRTSDYRADQWSKYHARCHVPECSCIDDKPHPVNLCWLLTIKLEILIYWFRRHLLFRFNLLNWHFLYQSRYCCLE